MSAQDSKARGLHASAAQPGDAADRLRRPLIAQAVSWQGAHVARFEELPGLPGTGPTPEQFSASGLGTHREGFVVKFFPDQGEPWIGNFQPGITSCCGVYPHPNGHNVLVVSGGQGYVVDAETRALVTALGSAIDSVHIYAARNLLILNRQNIAFEAIGRSGRAWHTRRLSWDGFRNVKFIGDEIFGDGWNAIDQEWESFTVDAQTGQSAGGAYAWQDAREWEQLGASDDAS